MIFSAFVFCAFISPRFVVMSQIVIALCEKTHPPKELDTIENCPLICSPIFHNYIHTKKEEIALCAENGTAITCSTNADCRKYHLGGMCRKLPCLCGGKPAPQMIYVLDKETKFQLPRLSTCVVSTKWMAPEMPLVPFPWGTLLVVFAIVASFVVCLLAVRWISPVIRRMQAKAVARNRRPSMSDDGTLFSSVPLQENAQPSMLPCRTPRITMSNLQAHRLRIAQRRAANQRSLNSDTISAGSSSALSPDKPPPYEVAIQGEPPSYDEVEQQPLNDTRASCDDIINRQVVNDSLLRPTESSISVTTI